MIDHHTSLNSAVKGLLNANAKKPDATTEIKIPEKAFPYNSSAASRCMKFVSSGLDEIKNNPYEDAYLRQDCILIDRLHLLTFVKLDAVL